MFCREYVFSKSTNLEYAVSIVCYPLAYSINCSARIEELRRMGIEEIVSFGKLIINDMNVVGKGHAAIVILAKHRDLGIVALKIRRMDSKRSSILHEGKLLEIASKAGIAPQVYAYTDNVIVREYIDGPTFRDFIYDNLKNTEMIKKATISLIRACYRLDCIGIELEEISIPLTQVIVECSNPEKIFIVDFESARRSEKPSNVTSVLGFVIGRSVFGKPFRMLIGLDNGKVARLRELSKEYKRVSLDKKRDIVEEIIELIAS